MNQTNCPNCGAPYDAKLTKCPYCGTNYFDLSFIDMDSTEPFYIKIKKSLIYNNHNTPCIISMKVLPQYHELNIEQQREYIYGYNNNTYISNINTGYNATINLGFQCIAEHNKPTIMIEEQKH